MITYICHNKNEKTGENLPCTNNRCETSVCPTCGGRADAVSQIFWCKKCKVPTYEEHCPICGGKGKKLATDIRPVFPEERLLIEIVLGEPFCLKDAFVWNGTGNHYYADGKKVPFSVKDLKNRDAEEIRRQYEKYAPKNSYETFEQNIKRFVLANKERYEKITEEAKAFIREASKEYSPMDMFVSFSGGKDSTVTADLVTRALSNPQIMHIFGDTTLEFPYTYEYVERLRSSIQRHR